MSSPSHKPITWKQKYNFDYGPPTHKHTDIGPPLATRTHTHTYWSTSGSVGNEFDS